MRRRAVKINRALQYAYERRTMLAEPPVLAASAQARVGARREKRKPAKTAFSSLNSHTS